MVIPTCTIIHPCIGVIVVRYVKDTPNIVCNRKLARQDLQIRSMQTTDSDHDYILDKILRWDQIDQGRKINTEHAAAQGLCPYFDNTLLPITISN